MFCSIFTWILWEVMSTLLFPVRRCLSDLLDRGGREVTPGYTSSKGRCATVPSPHTWCWGIQSPPNPFVKLGLRNTDTEVHIWFSLHFISVRMASQSPPGNFKSPKIFHQQYFIMSAPKLPLRQKKESALLSGYSDIRQRWYSSFKQCLVFGAGKFSE